MGKTCSVSVHLNHTIVSCRDQQRSAAFLSGILGLPPATRSALSGAGRRELFDVASAAARAAPAGRRREFDAAFGRVRPPPDLGDPACARGDSLTAPRPVLRGSDGPAPDPPRPLAAAASSHSRPGVDEADSRACGPGRQEIQVCSARCRFSQQLRPSSPFRRFVSEY